MRKKEFIHIHALFQEVTRYLIEEEDVPVEVQPTYDTLGVRAESIHKPKQHHCEAIAILGESIERSLEEANTDAQMLQ